jgi:predicted Zn finger-like uncharacterized protein
MPAELVSCPECKRKLRVPNELIGKLVKCPTCGQTFNADPATLAPPPDPTPTTAEKVARTSKVTRDKDEDDEDDERSRRRRSRSGRDDDDDDDRPRRRRSRYSRDDDDDDDDRRRRRRRDLMPHRGGQILTLGILSFVLPPFTLVGGIVCAIMSWSMGNTDLAEMRAGRMDPEGAGQTNAGRICGMLSVILHVLVIVGGLGFCCLMGLLDGAHGRH